MTKILNEVVANCKVCSKGKYNGYPEKHKMRETPYLCYAGQILHVDISPSMKNVFDGN